MTKPSAFLFALALVGFCAGAFAGLQDDGEIVREFNKYFKKYKETAMRVEAIRALGGVDQPEVVDALAPVLKDADLQVVDAAVDVLGGFGSREPVDRILGALEVEKTEPVRIGLLRALQKGAYGGLGEPVLVCLTDRSWEVRRAAILALSASGDRSSASRAVS